jgi:hypothetical protein
MMKTLPPGRVTRRASCSAAVGLAAYWKELKPVMTSKTLSSNGNSSRSPCSRCATPTAKGLHSPYGVRGSQYCFHDYQKLLRQFGFKVSMSGKGNCYDNSAVETFFKTIKAELIWRQSWPTRRATEIAIFNYINGFYNPRRRHSALGWKSPVAFERRVA